MSAVIRLKRRSEVAFRDLATETVLCHPDHNALHVLNVSSALLWDTLEQARTHAELEQVLRDSFDVPDDADVRAHVIRIVEALREADLIVEV